MKTAVQQIIEDLQDINPDYYNRNYNWLHSLLETEKKQIIDAYSNGYSDSDNTFSLNTDYYNQTFKKL